jgi:hypothetical protein
VRRLAAAAPALALSLAATGAGAQQLGEAEAASLFGPFAADLVAAPSKAEVDAAWPTQARADIAERQARALALMRATLGGKATLGKDL